MTPKTILWRGAVVALMTAMLTLSANAQTGGDRDPTKAFAQRGERGERGEREECKARLNAAGKAKFRPFTQKREVNGEGAAMADAIANWQRDVSAKYGSQWMLWERAVDKKENCAPARPGTIGSWFIRCTIEARPCGGGEARSEPGSEEVDYDECQKFGRGRVLEVQQRMNGCDTCRGHRITVDGSCGPQTERCIRQFQSSRFGREKGLEPNGLPGFKTVAALREYCDRN
jgi:peptidoglycan hydrolase-like protein with peptidoglycan-binding domain